MVVPFPRRQLLAWALIVILGAGLAACHRQASAPAASQPAAQEPSSAPAQAVRAGGATGASAVPDGRPLIAAFGDSITAGLGVDAGKTYPDDLQRLLDAHELPYRVGNFGISGETTADALERLDWLLAARPAIVILEFGGNDGLRGIPVTATRANLDAILARLKAAHVRVVLAGMSLPPNYGPDYIASFRALYADLARRYETPLIPFLLQPIVDHYHDTPNLMQEDGIHPTAAGDQLVAEEVFKALLPLLQKSRPVAD